MSTTLEQLEAQLVRATTDWLSVRRSLVRAIAGPSTAVRSQCHRSQRTGAVMTTHTKVETELIPFSCAYGECDHKREDECPAHKDFICQECTDALDDDAACVLWEDYDHQVALIGSGGSDS